MTFTRGTRWRTMIGCLAVAFAGCEDFVASPVGGTIHPVLRVLAWPDTLFVGDSAVAHVEVQGQTGEYVPLVDYRWEVDNVRIAGLHGGGPRNQRRVLGFRVGSANLRVTASATVTTCGNGTSSAPCATSTIVHIDSVRPIIVRTR